MIIRVFPRRTQLTPDDPLAFVGDPPLAAFRPVEVDEVYISVAFSWDVGEAHRLASSWAGVYPRARVFIGGPAMNSTPSKFCSGLYIKQGVTFTTRGCNNKCPWCLVWKREGKLAEIEDFQPGYIIQDNNLLQSSKKHMERVFGMLASQKRSAVFSGGFQASLVSSWVVEELRRVRIEQLFLAADTDGAIKPLAKAIEKLDFLPRRKLRVYTLIGFDGETPEKAEKRLESIWELGGLPFAQLYQPTDKWIEYGPEWKQLARKWSRPAAMFSQHSSQRSIDYCPRLF